MLGGLAIIPPLLLVAVVLYCLIANRCLNPKCELEKHASWKATL